MPDPLDTSQSSTVAAFPERVIYQTCLRCNGPIPVSIDATDKTATRAGGVRDGKGADAACALCSTVPPRCNGWIDWRNPAGGILHDRSELCVIHDDVVLAEAMLAPLKDDGQYWSPAEGALVDPGGITGVLNSWALVRDVPWRLLSVDLSRAGCRDRLMMDVDALARWAVQDGVGIASPKAPLSPV